MFLKKTKSHQMFGLLLWEYLLPKHSKIAYSGHTDDGMSWKSKGRVTQVWNATAAASLDAATMKIYFCQRWKEHILPNIDLTGGCNTK